jgi:hypothetical protein
MADGSVYDSVTFTKLGQVNLPGSSSSSSSTAASTPTTVTPPKGGSPATTPRAAAGAAAANSPTPTPSSTTATRSQSVITPPSVPSVAATPTAAATVTPAASSSPPNSVQRQGSVTNVNGGSRWSAHTHSVNGKIYWYDSVSKTTTWIKPDGYVYQPTNLTSPIISSPFVMTDRAPDKPSSIVGVPAKAATPTPKP